MSATKLVRDQRQASALEHIRANPGATVYEICEGLRDGGDFRRCKGNVESTRALTSQATTALLEAGKVERQKTGARGAYRYRVSEGAHATSSPRDEARELARRWPWSLSPCEKTRLHTLASEWMTARRKANDLDADLGEWLGRSIEDAHAIAREVTS